MSFEFEVIAAALFSIVDIYCIYRLLDYNLTFRFSKKAHVSVYIGSYVLYMLMQVLAEVFSFYPIKLPLTLLFYISFMIIYSDAFYMKLFWIFFAMLTLTICELIASPFAMLVTHTSLEDISHTKSAYCIGMVISRILFFLLIGYITRSKQAKKSLPLF